MKQLWQQKAQHRPNFYAGGDVPVDDTRSWGGASSEGSADSLFIEQFPVLDSDPSLPGPPSSASDLESRVSHLSLAASRPQLILQKESEWQRWNVSAILSRALVKRRARRHLDKLIAADTKENEPAVAKLQRYNAAAGLMRIVEKERDGGETVARRFAKSKSRRAEGTRALLKLSDDELDKSGYEAIRTCSTQMASGRLLVVLLRNSNESSFLGKSISPLLRDGAEGPAAILYLAIEQGDSFFHHISDHFIFDFCKRVVNTEGVFNPKWYCAAKLLCMLLDNADYARLKLEHQAAQQSLLSTILKSILQTVTEEQETTVSSISEYQFVFRGLPVLPLLAGCCKCIKNNPELEQIILSTPLKSFLELLIHSVFPQQSRPGKLNTEGLLAAYALITFLKVASAAKLFLDVEFSRFAAFLVDWLLRPFESARASGEDMHYSDALNEDLYITCLCALPGSTSSIALSDVLKEGLVRLNSCKQFEYGPLDLVNRLLWLSNVETMKDQIHRALVEGGACEFLTQTLNHRPRDASDASDAWDRGLWRAKGLAMTCLGNIVERMNKEQFCNYLKEEMIVSVVAIKEDAAVPLVQKGQAIFLLQRYTLAADRSGVQPFYRENTSNMTEEYRSADPGNLARPPSAPHFGSGSSAPPPPSLPKPLSSTESFHQVDILGISEECRNTDPGNLARPPSAPREGFGSPALTAPVPAPPPLLPIVRPFHRKDTLQAAEEFRTVGPGDPRSRRRPLLTKLWSSMRRWILGTSTATTIAP
ncbi:hypothetical protein M407DRAFT_32017 [Tulasnella calospora MUT 4182]|uniref:Uncharacterized protein n=1 Tax=Tulasnella calospora MUT 4182 TaxID=1051891 RepID=A0A0C3PU20_9AGAM|nr:hypothetical protein M407DRAFT_32017 [Tulasnella calospora MUT 4182]